MKGRGFEPVEAPISFEPTINENNNAENAPAKKGPKQKQP